MAEIGIIRGYGEGYVNTGNIIKLIKALNRRFESNIKICEIPIGNSKYYTTELNESFVSQMKKNSVIFSGDILSGSNAIDYSIEDIAIMLGNNLKYVSIRGIDNFSNINIDIATYFDGGITFREFSQDKDGCIDTRACSRKSAMEIARAVCRQCEQRRRRLAFVRDGENEYLAKMFITMFENYSFPLSDFHLTEYCVKDIIYDMLCEESSFDTIFASETFSDYMKGILSHKMGEKMATYDKYASETVIYYVHSECYNAVSGDSVPSAISYITAFTDMIETELNLRKEAYALRKALVATMASDTSLMDGSWFVARLIKELQKPLNTKFPKKTVKRVIK